jgi:hypothetical protein
MQNDIVVIYEMKYMKPVEIVGGGRGNFFQIVYIEQITILPATKNR